VDLVSIIIPCYNQGNFLKETLDNILLQTYRNWECIIVNDGSTDKTNQIAKQYCQKDLRFKYLEKQNGGLSSARNAGLELSKGSYIQFLDCDDILCPEKVEHSIKYFKCDSELKIVITNFLVVYGTNPQTFPPFYPLDKIPLDLKTIILDWDVSFSIPIHCAIFKSELLESIRFDENLHAKEDWLFWVILFKNKPKYLFLNECLVKYRIHGKNMTSDIVHMYKYTAQAFEKVYFEFADQQVKHLLLKKINTFWQVRINALIIENSQNRTRRIVRLIDIISANKVRVLGILKKILK
jgi:glycosyltransferase involved in cell wall biosynthesis